MSLDTLCCPLTTFGDYAIFTLLARQVGVDFIVLNKKPIEPNAIYSREETAQILSVSLSTLKQLIRNGQLKVSQPAGLRRVFIRGTSILEMLERSERDAILPVRADQKLYELENQNPEPKSKRSKQISARTRVRSTQHTARMSGGANR